MKMGSYDTVFYDRVLEISAELGDAVVAKYTEGGVVCPPELHRGLFTTAAMDNIDHNPIQRHQLHLSMELAFHCSNTSLQRVKEKGGTHCNSEAAT